MSLALFGSHGKQVQRERSRATASESADALPEKRGELSRPLTGQYAGIVHNLSVNVSAEVAIAINDTDGLVSGCMGIKQPLFGSGPLSGFFVNSDVSFVVSSAIGEITFVGKRSKDSLSGTYSVAHQNGLSENGTFTLRKVKSEGLRSDLDMSNCPTDVEMNQ
jgi:hypothetical protein